MVKVISLSDAAYSLLRSLKGSNMSFSDVVMANFNAKAQNKEESLKEMLTWVKQLPKTNHKTNYSQRIDEIVYGLKT